ncbi:MAG: transcription termination/antitermination protein NusG [Alphaproteobacteria bacterium]|nr:transcription termination/antitermination protein NusG [Alphaproteobacteria bacterium]
MTSASAKWYVVNVQSGCEKKVVESLKEQIETKNLEDKLQEVLLPTESVTELKGNAKVVSERKFFPGYVLVKAVMEDQVWHLIKKTPKVLGFLGNRDKPMPITDTEAERILKQVAEGVGKQSSSIVFEVGEQVRVTDGPFATFTGSVEDVDPSKSRLKVSVSIFGRATPVELEFSQVEKI